MGVSLEELRRTVAAYILRLDLNPWIAVLWYHLCPDVHRFRTVEASFRELKRGWLSEQEFRVQEGAREAIASLREQGYMLAVAANQGVRAGEFLRREGLTTGFAWDLVPEDIGLVKPLPIFFSIILEAIGVAADEAIMVGDRLDHDILPAKLLGLRTVRVLAGPYAEQVPLSSIHCPDRTIRSLEEVLMALEDLTDRNS